MSGYLIIEASIHSKPFFLRNIIKPGDLLLRVLRLKAINSSAPATDETAFSKVWLHYVREASKRLWKSSIGLLHDLAHLYYK